MIYKPRVKLDPRREALLLRVHANAVPRFLRRAEVNSYRAVVSVLEERNFQVYLGGSAVDNLFEDSPQRKEYGDLDILVVDDNIDKLGNFVIDLHHNVKTGAVNQFNGFGVEFDVENISTLEDSYIGTTINSRFSLSPREPKNPISKSLRRLVRGRPSTIDLSFSRGIGQTYRRTFITSGEILAF